MARIKNISGGDLLVPGLGGRLVLAGQKVDVDPSEVTAYTQQESTWVPADDEAQALHEEMLEAIAYLRAVAVPEPTEADVAALLTIALTELGYREVIDELIPAATAEGLVVLLDVEAAGKNRKTVIEAAQKRLTDLTGAAAPVVDVPVDIKPGAADVGDEINAAITDVPGDLPVIAHHPDQEGGTPLPPATSTTTNDDSQEG